MALCCLCVDPFSPLTLLALELWLYCLELFHTTQILLFLHILVGPLHMPIQGYIFQMSILIYKMCYPGDFQMARKLP